jgi:hypothetical protein
MDKRILLLLAGLIIVAVYISRKTKVAGDDLKFTRGRFIRIDKTDSRFYNLYLKLKNDSIVLFKTIMPIDSTEIGFLKKSVLNIEVNYKEYNNPVTNTVDKIVQSYAPVYEFKKP